MIGLLDYGGSNLASVSSAFARLGAKTRIVRRPGEISACDALVIPGVGSFNAAMERLAPLRPAISAFAESGKPALGICLGMQVLFEKGSEGGDVKGLGLLSGSVEKMGFAPKLPHVGWNTAVAVRESPLFRGLGKEWFYFVHSFACKPSRESDLLAVTEYGQLFASAVERENVLGVQFHPEKSGAAGERLLKNFLEMV